MLFLVFLIKVVLNDVSVCVSVCVGGGGIDLSKDILLEHIYFVCIETMRY